MKYSSGAHKHFLSTSQNLLFLQTLRNKNTIEISISHFPNIPRYCTLISDSEEFA
jgi:hypothetical protein